ncbi:uncharacterized protein LOC112449920 [Kryptolebias marmoratus]|uniref:Septin-type G domain-containing protein n=1 Tax=Kryptolebias marmoratus TaxID=37003 RepID=A0A3Q3B008_KRYMA|nr:uncharacterized protein LOC112449920 [Kryptolebias marmoratus]
MTHFFKKSWNLIKSFTASQPNDEVSEVDKRKRLADSVKDKSSLLTPQTGPLPLYKVPLEEQHINITGCKYFKFGKDSPKQNRTIMVLGATGAGKSTLINGMINYILGVRWEDSYRFKLVDEGQLTSQAHSQTSEVTVYKLNHQDGFQVPFSLSIIDTPGFGDTRGIERDREIIEQLRNLFSSPHGVTEIDAVCFVAQASLARLTPSQKYVFDSILSIFGKDVAENIRILVTFADGQRPPVLEAIRVSGVPCPKSDDGFPVHFKFNNSALFADNKAAASSTTGLNDDENFDQMFWNMGTKSMKRFFVALNLIKTKSLTLTNEVLKERKQLENSVENLQKQVKLGLAKLEEIKETSEKLKEHEAEISRNENFEFFVTVTKPFHEDISGSGYITNCQTCHFTCHYPCGIADDRQKMRCCAMTDGVCRECPGKCNWNTHFNQKYKWEYKEVKEKQTAKKLKENFEKASGEKLTVEGLIDKLKAEYVDMQNEVVKLIEKSSKCLNRLKEIALKPNPLSTPEYIDLLIEGEKQEGKPGWKKRVEALMKMKEKAELMAEVMAKVEKGETLIQQPYSDLQQDHLPETEEKGICSDIKQDKTQNNTSQNQQETTIQVQNVAESQTETIEAKTDSRRNQTKISKNTKKDEVLTDSQQSQQNISKNSDRDQTEPENEENFDSDQDQTEPEDEEDIDSDQTEPDDEEDIDSDQTEPDDEGNIDSDSDQTKLEDEGNIDSDSDSDQPAAAVKETKTD